MSVSASSTTGMPTPSYSGTRPGSETNSYVQSCSSALSGVDDNRLDEILGDGLGEQTLGENRVTKEMQSHQDLRDAAANEQLPKVTAEEIYRVRGRRKEMETLGLKRKKEKSISDLKKQCSS